MVSQSREQIRTAWDGIAAGYGDFVSPTHYWVANEGLRRAGLCAGMQFLDVACGAGALSIPAARLGAHVLATDLSPRMLDRLKASATNAGVELETRMMDGHALELEDDTFDVVGSQFGVMLFPDMPRGIREMARVAKSGGRVLMTVYGPPEKIDFFSFFISALQRAVPHFSGPPIDPPPLPFQLQDPQRLHQELENAGLRDIRVETLTEELRFECGDDLWNWLVNSNPIPRMMLADLNPTHGQITKLKRTLDDLVRHRAGESRHATLTNPVHIGLGVK